MEFEPEWESAFNLHIKLATVISLALEWCGTDKVVLVKAYRATLRQLYGNPPARDATNSIIHGKKKAGKIARVFEDWL